jgi:hypothetical protein
LVLRHDGFRPIAVDVARMSEAKSGGVASFPGCRFAHPGYGISKRKTRPKYRPGFEIKTL